MRYGHRIAEEFTKQWTNISFGVLAVGIDGEGENDLGKTSRESCLDECFQRATAKPRVLARLEQGNGTLKDEVESVIRARALDWLHVGIALDDQ